MTRVVQETLSTLFFSTSNHVCDQSLVLKKLPCVADRYYMARLPNGDYMKYIRKGLSVSHRELHSAFYNLQCTNFLESGLFLLN